MMKRTILTICISLIIIAASYSQRVDTLYYSVRDKQTTSKRYFTYRVVRYEPEMVRVFEYYKNGDITMTGGYKSDDFKEKTGPFYYYSGDRVKSFLLSEQSKYPAILASLDGVLEKIPQQPDSLYLVIYYHKNKKIHSAGYRSECCYLYGPWIFFSKDGDYATIETYKNNLLDGPTTSYYRNFVYCEGQFRNDKKDGEWSYYYSDTHKLYKTEIYNSGKRIKTLRYKSPPVNQQGGK